MLRRKEKSHVSFTDFYSNKNKINKNRVSKTLFDFNTLIFEDFFLNWLVSIIPGFIFGGMPFVLF